MIKIDVGPSCPAITKDALIAEIQSAVNKWGLYSYVSHSKFTGDTQIDVTAYERQPQIDIDPDITSLLKFISEETDRPIKDVLRDAIAKVIDDGE